MKVVICGAGQVGANIAKYLAHEGNDVTIVDVDPHLVRDITDQLDVQGIAGFASHPNVLEQAGLRDADLLIAVTHCDEVNMTACMVAGDDVYFIAETAHLKRALSAFGHEEQEARHLIVVGGGNIGLGLSELIAARNPGIDVKLIELDRRRAALAAARLPNWVVIQGDALDPRILEEANVRGTETIIAVTNDDEVNILASRSEEHTSELQS